jgi:hypothetical protein
MNGLSHGCRSYELGRGAELKSLHQDQPHREALNLAQSVRCPQQQFVCLGLLAVLKADRLACKMEKARRTAAEAASSARLEPAAESGIRPFHLSVLGIEALRGKILFLQGA